jgi:hypothetical protein
MSNVIRFEKYWKQKRCNARDAKVSALMVMPIELLKALWDRYDGGNAPDGHDGEDIHMVLNMRGCGEYCAV